MKTRRAQRYDRTDDRSTARNVAVSLHRWRRSYPYDETVRYGSLLGLLGVVRLTIAASTLTIILSGSITLLSPTGASGGGRLVLLSIYVAALGVALLWLRAPWPTKFWSVAFVVGADLAIATGLLQNQSGAAALPGTSLFVLVGIYVAFIHGPRELLIHGAITVLTLVTLGMWALQSDGDPARTWSMLISLTAVQLGVPAFVQIAWATVREEGIRSLHDPLTKLLNRRGLYAAIIQKVSHMPDDRTGVAITFDLDRFKEINDAEGHEAGDQALRNLAVRLTDGWTYPGKWSRSGGEEFALFTTIDARTAPQDLGDRTVELAAATEGDWPVTASVGVAVASTRPPTAEGRRAVWAWFDQLCIEADDAMYEAKRQGGAAAVVVHQSV